MTKENKACFLISIFIFIITFGILFLGFYFSSKNKEKTELETQDQIKQIEVVKKEDKSKLATDSVSSLYENNIPKLGISKETIDNVIEQINNVEEVELKESLLKEVELIKDYQEVYDKINTLVVNDVLISNYSNDDIKHIKELYNTFPDEWKKTFSSKLDLIDKQISIINKAKKNVKNLFSDSKLTKVKSNVTRSKYNKAKKSVAKIVQKDLKSKYNKDLAKVLKVVEEKEEKARKAEEERRKREAQIKAAWVVLDAPYISQNKSKVYNGCEAASLLMGLQYKGYLKNTSFYSFVNNMPKSENNPHEGFVLDIYAKEPRDLPHWIAPDALAKYGRTASGNNGVVDITGYSMDQLKKEIDANNPVIIYVTGGKLSEPHDWKGEVPVNLHVALMIGYNPISKQIVINDPWTRSSDGKMYYSEAKVTSIYNKVGKKAVVIR